MTLLERIQQEQARVSRDAYLQSTDAYGIIRAVHVTTHLGYVYCVPCADRLSIQGDSIEDNLTTFECDGCGVGLASIPYRPEWRDRLTAREDGSWR